MGLNDNKHLKEKSPVSKEDPKPKKISKVSTGYRSNSAVSSNTNRKQVTTAKPGKLFRSQSVDCVEPITGRIPEVSQSEPVPSPSQMPVKPVLLTKNQNQKKLTTSSRVSDSEQIPVGTTKSQPVGTSRSVGSISRNPAGAQKKRRPFSFAKDFNEDTSHPSVGDVQGLKVSHNYNTRPKSQKSVDSEPEVRGARVHFSDIVYTNDDVIQEMETSLQEVSSFKESKQTEQIPSVDHSQKLRMSDSSVSKPQVQNKKPPTVREQGHKDDTQETSIDQKIQAQQTKDELMIAKTDDLILEVARFITQIKSSRAEHFPVEVNFQTPSEPERERYDRKNTFDRVIDSDRNSPNLSMELLEVLSSGQCPSISKEENLSGWNTETDNSLKPEGVSISRPTSASLPRSVSNEDVHGRIALTLRMIEQEELREWHTKTNSIPDNLQKFSNPMESNHEDYALPSVSVSNSGSRPSSRSSVLSVQQETCRVAPSLSPVLPIISSPRNTHIDRPSSELSNSGTPCPGLPGLQSENVDSQVSHSQSQNHQEIETSRAEYPWQTSDKNTKKIFSFLDEVERTDRETLFGLKFESTSTNPVSSERNLTSSGYDTKARNREVHTSGNNLPFLQKIDSLLRKGSVELAKEQIIIERKLEESQQRIQVLEDTLMSQRELNMRNLRNSERDLKKRLKLQKEEFDIAFARNEALINEMAAEKRILQERCDKLLKSFDETEEKYKEQIKSLQQSHLEEIKRLRKAQINAENTKKQQWVGNKTKEIREMTVKGLEPEVQRMIQRHQQEMCEMRAWHSDEIRETEERYQRKMHMQVQDMKEKCTKEAEEVISRERELSNNRLESLLKQREDEFECQKRRLANDIYEERERAASEEVKLRELMQENIRKVQVKAEIEIENLKQEHETRIASSERRHANELKSLKDVHEAEKENWMSNYVKKYDLAIKERESQVTETLRVQMDTELREKEKKLREEFNKIRREDEVAADARIKRMQEKYAEDLQEMDQSERELKAKFSQAKSELLQLEEQVFSLKTSLSVRDKQNTEFQEANLRMLEERANLTSVIRREFASQIESMEEEVRTMRTALLEIQTKHKLESDQNQLEVEKLCHEKDAEFDKIGLRVKQTVARKEETIQELQKQLEKCNFQIQHLEGLLEEQRKSFLDSMTKPDSTNVSRKRK